MQNLVVLMDPSDKPFDISMKGGNMFFNRFCVDEDAAFELSGVHYLRKASPIISSGDFSSPIIFSEDFSSPYESKGKGTKAYFKRY